MSVASYSNHQDLSLYKKPSIQRRNHSGELDVFEAANYFSASTIYDKDKNSLNTHKPDQEYSKTTSSSCDKEHQAWVRPAGARTSVDAPNSRLLRVQPMLTVHSVNGGQSKEKVVKSKQPSSPGGRLASFLNSLFNNDAAKKKKKSAQDQDHHQRPRMGRSSMSHLDSSRSMCIASSTATGFRTPPKIYKTFDDDSRSLQDHRRVAPTPDKSQFEIGKNGAKLISLSDQKLIRISSGFDKNRRNSTNGLPQKENMVYGSESKKGENIVKNFDQLKKVGNTVRAHFEFKRSLVEDDDDDGVESDTSSDLFELQLGDFSSGLLPVYETINADGIKNSLKHSLLSK